MMPKIRPRVLLRRTLQGLVLAGFLTVFFWLTPPQVGTSQLAFEPTHRSAPVFLLCLIDPLASLASFLAARTMSLLMLVPLAIVATSLVWPRIFCSHLCPVGQGTAQKQVAGVAAFSPHHRSPWA